MSERDCGFCHPEKLTAHGQREVERFSRWLRVAPKPGEGNIRRDLPGWLPYLLGLGPEPPEGMDSTPVTAWSVSP